MDSPRPASMRDWGHEVGGGISFLHWSDGALTYMRTENFYARKDDGAMTRDLPKLSTVEEAILEPRYISAKMKRQAIYAAQRRRYGLSLDG